MSLDASPPIVLVVEDEWMLRIEMVDALVADGWTVAESSSGEHAFGRLSRGEQFDLLVTDIRLGGTLNGWDVAKEWRAKRPDAPVVYVSANDPQDARRVDCSLFFAKPIVMAAFVETCRVIRSGNKL